MNSKTPKFEEALGKILDNLEPHTKECQECNKDFKIMAEDIEFYKKLQVPPATLCPSCRMQRRLAHRCVLPVFYKKICSAPGHNEKVISFYSEKNPVKIYDDKYYSSDEWEASDFTSEYNQELSFFEQFKDFRITVPQAAISRDMNSTNCGYTVSGNNSKDCYYSAAPIDSENVHFSSVTISSKDSMDLADVDNSEYCYDSVYLNRCYNVKYSLESADCMNSDFLYDCKNCSDCFMSANLRHKQYYFYNKELGKEEYMQKMAEINLGDRNEIKKLKEAFTKMLKVAIHKNLNNEKINNSVGNLLRECNNCYMSSRIFEGSENIRYSMNGHSAKDSMDAYGNLASSLIYESGGLAMSSDVKFSIMIRSGLSLEYCTDCTNCEYCFACTGLKNKKYHIFNKAYTEDEYWQKVDEIKIKMLVEGEYGEFFPVKNSMHPYQDTVAMLDYPLDEKDIASKGWYLRDKIDSELDLSKMEVLNGGDIPSDIHRVDDTILNKVLICEKTNEPFKIVKFEFEFYKQKGIPLPTIHPLQRVKDRAEYKYGLELYEDVCGGCGNEILSAHNPEKDFRVYCEKCYNEEVV